MALIWYFYLCRREVLQMPLLNTIVKNETWFNSDYIKFLNQVLLARKYSLIFIIILIIMGNSLVLLATWRERSLHQPNKYFIACLAVADLLVGIFIGSMRVYRMNLLQNYKLQRDHDFSIHLCRFMV